MKLPSGPTFPTPSGTSFLPSANNCGQPLVFFEAPTIVITYDKVNDLIHADWKGLQTPASVIAGGEKILAGIQKYCCKKVINDNRNVEGPWVPADDWFFDDFLPRLSGSCCRHIAWVHSQRPESQPIVEAIVKEGIRNIKLLIFDDLRTARLWLLEV